MTKRPDTFNTCQQDYFLAQVYCIDTDNADPLPTLFLWLFLKLKHCSKVTHANASSVCWSSRFGVLMHAEPIVLSIFHAKAPTHPISMRLTPTTVLLLNLCSFMAIVSMPLIA